MLMAYLAHTIGDLKSFTILHFNHWVRKTADDDLSILKKAFPSTRIIVWKAKNPWTTETEFRSQRLTFFRKNTHKWACIFTGHSLSDRVETTIINSSRWTWIAWLRSIEEISYHEQFCFYRPLLSFSKSEIVKMCKMVSLPFSIDETNKEEFTVRNSIRKYYQTESINPDFWNRFYTHLRTYCTLRQHAVWLRCFQVPSVIPFSKIHTCNISTYVDTNIVMSMLWITWLSKSILQKFYSILTRQKNGYVNYNWRNIFKAFWQQWIFYGENKCRLDDFAPIWNWLSRSERIEYLQYFWLPVDSDIMFFTDWLRIKNSSIKIKKVFWACNIPVFLRRFIPLPKDFSKQELMEYFVDIRWRYK